MACARSAAGRKRSSICSYWPATRSQVNSWAKRAPLASLEACAQLERTPAVPPDVPKSSGHCRSTAPHPAPPSGCRHCRARSPGWRRPWPPPAMDWCRPRCGRGHRPCRGTAVPAPRPCRRSRRQTALRRWPPRAPLRGTGRARRRSRRAAPGACRAAWRRSRAPSQGSSSRGSAAPPASGSRRAAAQVGAPVPAVRRATGSAP